MYLISRFLLWSLCIIILIYMPTRINVADFSELCTFKMYFIQTDLCSPSVEKLLN